MTQKITLFQTTPPNGEDFKTKHGKLSPVEFDEDLIALYNADVKSIEKEGYDLILVKKDGEKFVGKDLLKPENGVKGVTFDRDTCNIVITYTNGTRENVQHLKDFLLSCKSVSTDSTINGDGSPINPLSLSDNYKTGQFMPVDGIVKCAEGGCNCNENDCTCLSQLPNAPIVGERFVTKEKINPYGKLYNFHGVRHIAKALCTEYHYHTEDACKGWHIPTIDDWNDLLNSIEPNAIDRNHADNCTCCGDKGKWAGMLLKSALPYNEGGWKPSILGQPNNSNCGNTQYTDCNHNNTTNIITDNGNCNPQNNCSCEPMGNGGIYNGNKPCGCTPSMTLDAYGFSALPAGYGTHSEQLIDDGVLTYFWTSSFLNGQVFVKRLCHDSNKVHSGMMDECEFASVRLVKDYDPKTYKEFETILGKTYKCVLMPSSCGKKVWLASNFDGDCSCCPTDCIHQSSLTPGILERFSFPSKFYINEWNGFAWIKNELNEGDSFVVKGGDMRELRVKKNIVTTIDSTIVKYELINPFSITLGDDLSNQIITLNDGTSDTLSNILGSLKAAIAMAVGGNYSFSYPLYQNGNTVSLKYDQSSLVLNAQNQLSVGTVDANIE